jgi:hypothetical protein
MIDEPPQGRRFSHIYLERGAPGSDSQRMRSRLAALTEDTANDVHDEIERELGIHVRDWRQFFKDGPLHDVLDTVTIIWRWLARKARSRGYHDEAPAKWVAEVARIFREENLQYRVDPRGGVHYYLDEEFERNRTSTIARLGIPRYENVARNFQEAHDHLSAVPPEGKNAIRATFAAAEGLFRLMFPNEPRLTANGARTRLQAPIQRLYAGNYPALGTASKLLRSFSEWIEAAQFYRHEFGTEEVVEPPLDLVANLVSLGASYLRWLIELDEQKPPP